MVLGRIAYISIGNNYFLNFSSKMSFSILAPAPHPHPLSPELGQLKIPLDLGFLTLQAQVRLSLS